MGYVNSTFIGPPLCYIKTCNHSKVCYLNTKCVTTIITMHAYFVFKNIFLRIIILIKNNSLVIQVVHMNSLYVNYYNFFLSSYGNDGLPAVIDELSCFYSTYLTIFQCSYSTSISSSCTSDNDVSVSCCKFVTVN